MSALDFFASAYFCGVLGIAIGLCAAITIGWFFFGGGK
jgi:uncharacterized membrane protein YqgA involved in biofilm formation